MDDGDKTSAASCVRGTSTASCVRGTSTASCVGRVLPTTTPGIGAAASSSSLPSERIRRDYSQRGDKESSLVILLQQGDQKYIQQGDQKYIQHHGDDWAAAGLPNPVVEDQMDCRCVFLQSAEKAHHQEPDEAVLKPHSIICQSQISIVSRLPVVNRVTAETAPAAGGGSPAFECDRGTGSGIGYEEVALPIPPSMTPAAPLLAALMSGTMSGTLAATPTAPCGTSMAAAITKPMLQVRAAHSVAAQRETLINSRRTRWALGSRLDGVRCKSLVWMGQPLPAQSDPVFPHLSFNPIPCRSTLPLSTSAMTALLPACPAVVAKPKQQLIDRKGSNEAKVRQ